MIFRSIFAIRILLRAGLGAALLLPGVSFAREFHGFTVCEIAHPAVCWEFVSTSEAGCKDLLGTFLGHHNRACHTGSKACAIDGPGIAELEGLMLPNPVNCEAEGVRDGWYHFDHGTLLRDKNLKACKSASKDGFGIGVPNLEQCFPKPLP